MCCLRNYKVHFSTTTKNVTEQSRIKIRDQTEWSRKIIRDQSIYRKKFRRYKKTPEIKPTLPKSK